MKHLKSRIQFISENFLENINRDKSTADFDSYPDDHIYAQVGNQTITKADVARYRDNIESWYGHFSDQKIDDALGAIYNAQNYWKSGGILYRVVWLNDISEFNKSDLGHHWVEYESYCDDIVEGLGRLDEYKDKQIFVIKAKTPPHNVSLPSDPFNNINEQEIMIIDPSKMEFISITEYGS